VLDAGLIAQRTGAVLVGSRSSAMVGRGAGLPEDRVLVPDVGVPLHFGSFSVTVLPSRHAVPARLPGDIAGPLVPPARVSAYRGGPCFSLLVEHSGRRLLLHGSAGWVRGALQTTSADVVYLAVAGLAKQSPRVRSEYWEQVVGTVGARRVVPVHWDDLWRPLSRPLRPLPHVVDDVAATLRWLCATAADAGVDLRLPTQWQPTDPFVSLPA
jgi:L-ascorbate metabolism protein UlaG (beta-lactamase superfamily)